MKHIAMSKERIGPCSEKNCAWCCDPVKVDTRVSIAIPTDKQGKPIWKERSELLKPHDQETVMLKTYDCRNFDRSTGRCLDYENRPDVCRGTSCIDPKSKKSVDEQYNETVKTQFDTIKLK